MKILFVCTCLEPGSDGVGDYTRRLASELNARGHRCSLLAMSDFHVTAATRSSANSMATLRLPATSPWADRLSHAKKFVQETAPDWISWQFVLYGFDPRGLGFGLGSRLKEIAQGHRNQIMFHELWIGEARQAALKAKLIGKVQRSVIHDVLQKVRPQVVHTHTPLYQHLLDGLGCKTTRLPLFGNIPITNHPRAEWLEEKFGRSRADIQGDARAAWWIFLIFGSIHPEWDAEDFLRRALASAQAAGKKCALISMGRQGSAGEEKWRLLERRANTACKLLNLGRQTEEDISQGLLAADFGASAVPPEYIFKSGTAAAMIEHGLPIIATRPRYEYTACPEAVVSARLANVVSDFDLAGAAKTKAGSLLPGVADQFIADLTRAENANSEA